MFGFRVVVSLAGCHRAMAMLQNGLYIFVAVVTSGAVVVSTGLVLKVLIALLKGVAMKRPSDDIANNTAFSNMLHRYPEDECRSSISY